MNSNVQCQPPLLCNWIILTHVESKFKSETLYHTVHVKAETGTRRVHPDFILYGKAVQTDRQVQTDRFDRGASVDNE